MSIMLSEPLQGCHGDGYTVYAIHPPFMLDAFPPKNIFRTRVTLLFCKRKIANRSCIRRVRAVSHFSTKASHPTLNLVFFLVASMCGSHTFRERTTQGVFFSLSVPFGNVFFLFGFRCRWLVLLLLLFFLNNFFRCSFIRSFAHFIVPFDIFYTIFIHVYTAPGCTVYSVNEDTTTNTSSKSDVSMCYCCCYERKNLSLMSYSFSFTCCFFFVSRCLRCVVALRLSF